MSGSNPHQPPPLPGPPIDPQPGAGRVTLRFFVGFLAGIAISVVAWIIGWDKLSKHQEAFPVVVIAVPAFKIIFSTVFLCIRRWRLMGVGMLVSIAVGTLIFGVELVGDVLHQCKAI